MKIFVKAKTGQKQAGIEKLSENIFVVRVKELPEKGLANAAIIAALSKYFRIAKSRVSLISGHASRQKLFEINNT